MGVEFDAFGDVIEANNGIFGAEQAALEPALADHDTAQTVETPSHVAVKMHCRGCGRPVEVHIEYAELIAIQYGIPPHVAYQGVTGALRSPSEWKYSDMHQAWWPNAPCGHCSNPCAPLVTPEEAQKHIAKARRLGWLNPQAEQRLAQIANQRADQLRQQQAMRASR